MTLIFKTSNEGDGFPKDVCKCSCHFKGHSVLHFMPCCKFTYEKYINENSSFDEEAYEALIKERNDDGG